MKERIRISYHVTPDFSHNLLIVCKGNGCKHVTKYNTELRRYGLSIKVKDDTHYGRLKTAEPKEDPATTERCTFGDTRPQFLKIRF